MSFGIDIEDPIKVTIFKAVEKVATTIMACLAQANISQWDYEAEHAKVTQRRVMDAKKISSADF